MFALVTGQGDWCVCVSLPCSALSVLLSVLYLSFLLLSHTSLTCPGLLCVEGSHLSVLKLTMCTALKELQLRHHHLLRSILSSVNCVTCLTVCSLTQAFVLHHVFPSDSDHWFTNQPCVQCALGNPTHNSAMVTERMKTSALWQQINGSLSPRISRTLNKI